jgi:NADPH-dependent glutamate synthase beta subunit-like oxidoreductase/NAD-dependent dihydropyrimidine dehydrogenase PreA subunit
MFRTCEQCGYCSSACPVSGVDGFNIRRILRHAELDLLDELASTPLPWTCTACGRCEEVCPNGIAILDIIRFLRSLTPSELIPEGPPCVLACPAGIDVPGYVRLIARGNPREAYERILRKVPFPGVLGRVCTHPCETACRRKKVNQPIAICALKRFAADRAGQPPESWLERSPDTGKRVAVIGAGPAGLTAAFYLRRKGHRVSLFEKKPEPGGMMRYGIPAYRLPEDVLEKEIRQVLATGIELKTNQAWGRDFTLAQLQADGFEAVFLSLGLSSSRKIELEGADLNGVLWGMDFLTAVKEGRPPAVKEKVTVIGGGNVAVDVALTALRLGAKEVTLACLEKREEMPANPWEIETALEEGITIMPSWGPRKILGDGGWVTGIELIQCTSVFDARGHFCPLFGEARETLRADQVILAVGQTADLSFLKENPLPGAEKGLLPTDPQTLQTNLPGIFAGGDIVKGPGTVIEAIASGRKAASAIDQYLGGDGNIEEIVAPAQGPVDYSGQRERGFADQQREAPPLLPLSDRSPGFPEVELGFSEEQAVKEASRCLQCDLEIRLALAAG